MRLKDIHICIHIDVVSSKEEEDTMMRMVMFSLFLGGIYRFFCEGIGRWLEKDVRFSLIVVGFVRFNEILSFEHHLSLTELEGGRQRLRSRRGGFLLEF